MIRLTPTVLVRYPWIWKSALVVTLGLVVAFGTSMFKDYRAAKREQTLIQQYKKVDQDLKTQQQVTVAAEQRAALAEGSKVVAEGKYQKSLARVKELERKYNASLPVVTTSTTMTQESDPCVEIRELYGAEHEAREDCGFALDSANTVIDAMKDANGSLHKENKLILLEVALQDERIQVVTEQRESEKARKVRWRTTALAALTTTLLLLL